MKIEHEKDKVARESREERTTLRGEEKREHGMTREKENGGKHIGFIDGDQAPKSLATEGTSHRREPGLIDHTNASRAVKFLNKSVERGEHSPMVGGHKNDHRTH